jgi:uncharacterized protein YkwD
MRAKILLGTLVVLGSFLINSCTVCGADKQQLLTQINNEREAQNLEPLVLSNEFCKSADIRAKEQAERFAHVRPDGSAWYTISERVNRENIAKADTEEQAKSENVMAAWMMSEDHRNNILSKRSRQIGIGVYVTDDGKEYVVTLTD